MATRPTKDLCESAPPEVSFSSSQGTSIPLTVHMVVDEDDEEDSDDVDSDVDVVVLIMVLVEVVPVDMPELMAASSSGVGSGSVAGQGGCSLHEYATAS